MAGFEDVINAAWDLLDADTNFNGIVTKNDFSALANTGTTSVILRPGSFTNDDAAYGGVFTVVWDLLIDIYHPYGEHIETVVEELTIARDRILNIFQSNMYLGLGKNNTEGVDIVRVTRGENLAVITAEDDTVTHFSFTIQVQVEQTLRVTLEA